MNKPKLERCPHCDGIADIEDWKVAYEIGTTIRCADCGACVSEGVEDGNGWRDRAIEKWNRRTPSPENKALTCEGCMYYEDDHDFDPCSGCMRLVRKNDYYRRPPEKGE